MLFVIPWGRHWIIGTTDTEWTLDKEHPAASRADIDYLLDHVNAVLSVPLSRDDVEGVYAGLRPLLSGESDETSKLSREHVVAHPVPGLVMIAGGKYTTYRVMAKDAVDAVAHGLDQRVPRSCTDRIPLAGAEGYQALWNARHRLAHTSGLHVARIEHLLQRYGSLIDEVLELIEHDPSLGRPLHGADDYLRAEIVYAATHEGARHLNDVLTRRTHISIETFHRGVAVAPGGRRAARRPARLGRRAGQARGRVLHQAGRGRAPVAGAGHRPRGRRHQARRPRDRAGRRPRGIMIPAGSRPACPAWRRR